MVFRDARKEPKIKAEGDGGRCDSPVKVSLQNCCDESQLPMYFQDDSGLSHDDLQSLAFILLSRNVNHHMNDVGKGLLVLDHTQLTEMKAAAAAAITVRNGENRSGRASDDSFLPGLHEDTALDILAWSSRSDYPNLACVNRKFKSLIGSGYLYRLRRQLGVIEHWIYLACILMPWEAFDPVRQRWMRLPRMPCDDCFTCADKESLAVGTQLLVFGRELSGFAIWMYSLLSHNWSRCPLMNLPRCLFGSSSLGEIAIVAGGSDKNGRILSSAELYNSELGVWQSLPDMNSPRKLCSGFFMDGKFYVIGGMCSQTECLTCGEEYNIETRTWRRIPNMYNVSSVGHPAMRSPPLVAIVNNQLYSADQATNEVKKYDKINNTWSVVKRLPVRADSSHGWGLAFKACGNFLLVIGGHRGPEGEVVVLHSWNPQDTSMDAHEWNVLAIKERAGSFVYNCAVMGC